MSCKSAIFVVNTTTGTALPVNSTYTPNTIIRRYGSAIQLAGNGISLTEGGYYDIAANVTVTAGAAGVVTAKLYRDGTPIPGATSSISAADGSSVTLPLNAIVRVTCPCNQANITVVMSGVATTSQNLAITAEKV